MGDLILNWMTFLGGVVGAAVGFVAILVVGVLLAIPYWIVTRRDQLDPNPKDQDRDGRDLYRTRENLLG